MSCFPCFSWKSIPKEEQSPIVSTTNENEFRKKPGMRLMVIKYIEFCVHNLHNEDPGVHNLLLSLYAKQDGSCNGLQHLNFNRTDKNSSASISSSKASRVHEMRYQRHRDGKIRPRRLKSQLVALT